MSAGLGLRERVQLCSFASWQAWARRWAAHSHGGSAAKYAAADRCAGSC